MARLSIVCGIIVGAALVASLLAPPGDANAAACRVNKVCGSTGSTSGGGSPIDVNFTGSGTADVNEFLDLTWQDVSMSGTDATLGDIQVSLDPGRASVGQSVPNGGNYDNTNFFYFRFEVMPPSPFAGTYVSADALELTATVPSLPPTGTYTMQNSQIDFHEEGDPTMTPVFHLDTASVQVQPADLPVPASRPWALLALFLVLAGSMTMALRRRSGPAGGIAA